MRFGEKARVAVCLLSMVTACGTSSPPTGGGGGGGEGGQGNGPAGSGSGSSASSGAGGNAGAGGGDAACVQVCDKAAALIAEYGCDSDPGECDCSPECADELAAWVDCLPHPQDTSACSCNAANELDCDSTVCAAEQQAFSACYYK